MKSLFQKESLIKFGLLLTTLFFAILWIAEKNNNRGSEPQSKTQNISVSESAEKWEKVVSLAKIYKEKLTKLLSTNNIPDKLQAIKSASSTLIGVLSKLQEISGTEQSASWQPELIDAELEQFSVATTLEAYKSDNLTQIDELYF